MVHLFDPETAYEMSLSDLSGYSTEDLLSIYNVVDVEIAKKSAELYYSYNIHDVKLIESLDNKMKYLFLAITIGFIGKVRMHEIFSQVKFWDTVVYNELLAKNIQVPPHKHQGDVQGIAGAYVKDPIPGLYEWLASLDLTSLYPSIIMAMNMSPETIIDQACEENILESMINMTYDTSFAKAKDVAVAANGSTYSRKKLGIMPEITAKMFANRKKFKGMMLGVQSEIQLIKAEMNKRGLHGSH